MHDYLQMKKTERIEQLAEETRNLELVCPNCQRAFDVFGIDTARRYQRPAWFMRAYNPQPLTSPLAAWLWVLTQCRYVEDRQQYGLDEVWQLARETFELRHGDCEDTSILLADWLAASGYQARVVLGEVHRRGHPRGAVLGEVGPEPAQRQKGPNVANICTKMRQRIYITQRIAGKTRCEEPFAAFYEFVAQTSPKATSVNRRQFSNSFGFISEDGGIEPALEDPALDIVVSLDTGLLRTA